MTSGVVVLYTQDFASGSWAMKPVRSSRCAIPGRWFRGFANRRNRWTPPKGTECDQTPGRMADAAPGAPSPRCPLSGPLWWVRGRSVRFEKAW